MLALVMALCAQVGLKGERKSESADFALVRSIMIRANPNAARAAGSRGGARPTSGLVKALIIHRPHQSCYMHTRHASIATGPSGLYSHQNCYSLTTMFSFALALVLCLASSRLPFRSRLSVPHVERHNGNQPTAFMMSRNARKSTSLPIYYTCPRWF